MKRMGRFSMKTFVLCLLLAIPVANAVSQCTFQRTDYPAGLGPYGLLSQGAYIWVTNFFVGTVSKVRADDATTVGTFPVGVNPSALAYDGANIWVSNQGDNTVTKLQASDGTNLGTFAAGDAPNSLVFDGTSIWVTDYLGKALTQLRISDGATLASYILPWSPAAVLFDGTSLWTTEDAYPGESSAVRKIRPSDGAVLGVFPLGGNGRFMAFDGANIWATNVFTSTVSKLRVSDGVNLGTFPTFSTATTPAPFSVYPFVIAFDGSSVWVTNNRSNNVVRLRTSDGANLDTCDVGATPVGVAFDGTNIWVANQDSGTLSRLSPFFAAQVQPPINADGSSVFHAKRGVVPVKFTLTIGSSPTCDLPSATISLFRTSGGTPGMVNEDSYTMPADNGSNFRVSDCQYVYNLGTSFLGAGTYQVKISIGGAVVGTATFGLD